MVILRDVVPVFDLLLGVQADSTNPFAGGGLLRLAFI